MLVAYCGTSNKHDTNIICVPMNEQTNTREKSHNFTTSETTWLVSIPCEIQITKNPGTSYVSSMSKILQNNEQT